MKRSLKEDTTRYCELLYEDSEWKLYKSNDPVKIRELLQDIEPFETTWGSTYTGKDVWHFEVRTDELEYFDKNLKGGSFWFIQRWKEGKLIDVYRILFDAWGGGDSLIKDKNDSIARKVFNKLPKELLDNIIVDAEDSVCYGDSIGEDIETLKEIAALSKKPATWVTMTSILSMEFKQVVDFFKRKLNDEYQTEALNLLMDYKNGLFIKNQKVLDTDFKLKDSPQILEYLENNQGVLEIPEGITYLGDIRTSLYGSNVSKVILPNSLKGIAADTFRDLKVDELILPGELESIGKHTFAGAEIGTLSIPLSLKKIGENAFYGAAIRTLVLPKDWTEIPERAFYGLKVSSKIKFPKNCKIIKSEAFGESILPASLDFPESLIKIESEAFSNASFGKYLELPESLQYIGERAFSGADGFQLLEMGDEITFIGDYAFLAPSYHTDRAVLKQVKLPNNPDTKYGSNIFRGRETLEKVINMEYLLNQDPNAFVGTAVKDALKYSMIARDLEEEKIEVYDNPNTQKFAKDCFRYNEHLKKVVFGENLKRIGSNAFFRCTNLKIADFSNVKSKTFMIGREAFAESGLEKVIFPPEATIIFEARVFSSCESLKEVFIPEGTYTASENLFSGCKGLKVVNLPKSLRTIKDRAFYSCPIEHIDLPPRLGSIGEAAFEYTALKEIKIPKRIGNIAKYAFAGCEGLSKVGISTNLTHIEDCAFMDCANLTNFIVYNQEEDPEFDVYLDVDWEHRSFEDSPIEEVFAAGDYKHKDKDFEDDEDY